MVKVSKVVIVCTRPQAVYMGAQSGLIIETKWKVDKIKHETNGR